MGIRLQEVWDALTSTNGQKIYDFSVLDREIDICGVFLASENKLKIFYLDK